MRRTLKQMLRVFINISVYIVQPTQWNWRPVDGGGGEEGEEGERRSPVGFICIAVFLDLSLPALGRGLLLPHHAPILPPTAAIHGPAA